ncbi:MAG: lipoate--protein ligase family protein [Pirellulales bacterium]|nr:lipoate--protein ligase family protein [Pirellulales bacterium]
MRHLPLTLDSPAANLALDDALQDEVEAGLQGEGVLRVWESPRPVVVLGRSSRVDQEVRIDACRRDEIPVLRRTSGGAAIVAGPGCLMYAVVLEASAAPGLPAIDVAHKLVLERIAAALAPQVPAIRRSGTSDLAIAAGDATPVKVSGNSLRVRRQSVLYHGTLLYDFDVACMGRWLAEPPRQPEYRNRRSHDQFVTNLPLSRAELVETLATAWGAVEPLPDWPRERTAAIVAERYARPDWTIA